MEELSGYWEGYFIYGLGFDLPFFGERVRLFTEMEFKDGIITGHQTEEKGPFSTGRTVNFTGFWEQNLISLTVSYISNDVILEDGFNTEEIEHNFEIVYNGSFDYKKKAMNGIWFMQNEMDENLDLEIPPAEGLWVLKKAKKPVSDFDYSLLGL